MKLFARSTARSERYGAIRPRLAELYARYRAGETTERIAADLDVSASMLGRWFEAEYGRKWRRKGPGR